MRVVFSLVFLLVLISNTFSQSEISGRVLDESDNTPLEYAHVYIPNQKVGALTDSLGAFRLRLKSDHPDTLIVSIVRYETRYLIAKEGSRDIKLSANMLELPQLNFESGNIRDTIVGFDVDEIDPTGIYGNIMGLSRANARLINSRGQEIGLKCVLPKESTYCKIKKVRFYFPNAGNPKAPFRLNLYSYDRLAHLPGESLLKQSVICKPKGGDRWFEKDIEDLHIYTDSNVFYVTMERLASDKKKYFKKRNLKKNKNISDELKHWHKSEMFGQVMGMYVDKEMEVVSYNHFDGWYQGSGNRTPMIQVIVDYAK